MLLVGLPMVPHLLLHLFYFNTFHPGIVQQCLNSHARRILLSDQYRQLSTKEGIKRSYRRPFQHLPLFQKALEGQVFLLASATVFKTLQS